MSTSTGMRASARVRAHARWELRLLLRNGEQILLMFVIPIALLVALVVMRRSEIDTQVPIVMTVSLIATCFTSLAIGTGFERRSGALTFLATTPLSRVDLLLGKAIATAALASLSIAVLALVAAMMGWRPNAQWPVLVLFIVVGGGAFAGQHIVAIAPKPLFGFGAVGEPFGVGRRGQRGDGFAGAGVRALGGRLLGMAGAATPLFAMGGVKKLLAANRLGRLARRLGIARQHVGRGQRPCGRSGTGQCQRKACQRREAGHG